MTDEQVNEFIADIDDLRQRFVDFAVKWPDSENRKVTPAQQARVGAATAAFIAALDSVAG